MIDCAVDGVLTVVAAGCQVLLFAVCGDFKLAFLDVELLNHHWRRDACVSRLDLREGLLLPPIPYKPMSLIQTVSGVHRSCPVVMEYPPVALLRLNVFDFERRRWRRPLQINKLLFASVQNLVGAHV